MTLYSFPDENNRFEILLESNEVTEKESTLKHGSIVKLVHNSTQKKLHSHSNFKPPVSQKEDMLEVTGYGDASFPGDSNDHWRIEVVNEKNIESNSFINSIFQTFENDFI